MSGDPVGQTWIPYLGIRGRSCKKTCSPCPTLWDPEYKWRVIGGPLAWNNWQNAFGIHCANAAVAPTVVETTTTTYTLKGNSGRFLEAEAEASTYMMPNVRAGLWVAGSWLEIDGTGRLESSVFRSDDFLVQPGTRDIPDSSYTRSYVATGIVLGLGF
ncbi:MAG: hypothetical protein HY912_24750 [Desulfomonile tiedjei]|uniref:Uncharacterized protein n=1 Tax=Desulfomonile tiedjei TaxID=2358 RepID=A0A9D6Z2Y4_9BACT|nr:hypothetical protein [Desulfomonile tiedjei]